MDYKSLMGYGKKKKVTKKESKSKINKVLESINEEFGYKDNLKEVGAAPLYRKHIKKIEKIHKLYGKEVLDFYELLRKQGVNDESLNLLTQFKDGVLKFGVGFKKIVKKLL